MDHLFLEDIYDKNSNSNLMRPASPSNSDLDDGYNNSNKDVVEIGDASTAVEPAAMTQFLSNASRSTGIVVIVDWIRGLFDDDDDDAIGR